MTLVLPYTTTLPAFSWLRGTAVLCSLVRASVYTVTTAAPHSSSGSSSIRVSLLLAMMRFLPLALLRRSVELRACQRLAARSQLAGLSAPPGAGGPRRSVVGLFHVGMLMRVPAGVPAS